MTPTTDDAARPAYASASRCSSGISARHGGHHVAHKIHHDDCAAVLRERDRRAGVDRATQRPARARPQSPPGRPDGSTATQRTARRSRSRQRSPANATATQTTRPLIALPIAHPDLRRPHPRARSYRWEGPRQTSECRESATSRWRAASSRPFEQAAVAVEHFRAAARDAGCDVVRLNETFECALEFIGRKAAVESNLALNAFQGVCLLRRTKRRRRAGPNPRRESARRRPAHRTARAYECAARCRDSSQARRSFSSAKTNRACAYVRNLAKTGERVRRWRRGRPACRGCDAGRRSRPARTPSRTTRRFTACCFSSRCRRTYRSAQIADAIPAHKDVDGSHPMNQGHLAFGSGTDFVPATPAAVMLLLERSPHWPLRGRRAVMVGRSIVVGAPVALLMLAQDATVTVLHKESGDLAPVPAGRRGRRRCDRRSRADSRRRISNRAQPSSTSGRPSSTACFAATWISKAPSGRRRDHPGSRRRRSGDQHRAASQRRQERRAHERRRRLDARARTRERC